MTDIRDLIARVKELDKAATPGHWQSINHGNYVELWCEETRVEDGLIICGNHDKNADTHAQLISEYRTAAPILAEALEIALSYLEAAASAVENTSEGPRPTTHAWIAQDALKRIAKLGEKP